MLGRICVKRDLFLYMLTHLGCLLINVGNWKQARCYHVSDIKVTTFISGELNMYDHVIVGPTVWIILEVWYWINDFAGEQEGLLYVNVDCLDLTQTPLHILRILNLVHACSVCLTRANFVSQIEGKPGKVN